MDPNATRTYQDALKAANDLVEEPTVDAPGRREYMRGMVELIADLFNQPAFMPYIADRKRQIATDLGWPEEMIA